MGEAIHLEGHHLLHRRRRYRGEIRILSHPLAGILSLEGKGSSMVKKTGGAVNGTGNAPKKPPKPRKPTKPKGG